MLLGIAVTLGLFFGLLAAIEIGRWARRRMADPEAYDSTAADTV